MTDSLGNIPLFSWELGLIEYMWQFCLSMAKANSADALKAYATVIDMNCPVALKNQNLIPSSDLFTVLTKNTHFSLKYYSY